MKLSSCEVTYDDEGVVVLEGDGFRINLTEDDENKLRDFLLEDMCPLCGSYDILAESEICCKCLERVANYYRQHEC